MEDVEVRQEGHEWAVYVGGKLLQGRLPSKAFALSVASSVKGSLGTYAGPNPSASSSTENRQ